MVVDSGVAEQVADVRRPPVSATHIIQAGIDFFIWKDEAYIMNRKKKEKSMLRKEGNVYVLDLFLSRRWKGAKKASHVRLQQPNFLTAGVVSVEDRSK